MGVDDAAESETTERRLRELAPCTETSHVHADPRSPYACALLRERERYRRESAADRAYIAELETRCAAIILEQR